MPPSSWRSINPPPPLITRAALGPKEPNYPPPGYWPPQLPKPPVPGAKMQAPPAPPPPPPVPPVAAPHPLAYPHPFPPPPPAVFVHAAPESKSPPVANDDGAKAAPLAPAFAKAVFASAKNSTYLTYTPVYTFKPIISNEKKPINGYKHDTWPRTHGSTHMLLAVFMVS